MKTLVVYYSRTGNTRKVGMEISKMLNADLEEITEAKSRSGIIGYLTAGGDSLLGRPGLIKQPYRDPSLYDLVIVGTPVWAFTVSAPVRTYLSGHGEGLKKVAFYCTCHGSWWARAFKAMEEACGKTPAAVMKLTDGEVSSGGYVNRIKAYAMELSLQGKDG